MNQFLSDYGLQILYKVWEHLYISALSVGLGVLFAVPLGAVLSKAQRIAPLVMNVVGFLQTIPSLALLSLMLPIFGVGKLPAIIALFLYSLLPILRNTFVGISSVDKSYTDAAKGMGMSSLQILLQVELPMALGIIMAGIRVSVVYVISWTTLAAYIGGGGLGDFVFNGLTLYRIDLLLMGALPVTALALSIDLLMKALENKFTLEKRNI